MCILIPANQISKKKVYVESPNIPNEHINHLQCPFLNCEAQTIFSISWTFGRTFHNLLQRRAGLMCATRVGKCGVFRYVSWGIWVVNWGISVLQRARLTSLRTACWAKWHQQVTSSMWRGHCHYDKCIKYQDVMAGDGNKGHVTMSQKRWSSHISALHGPGKSKYAWVKLGFWSCNRFNR